MSDPRIDSYEWAGGREAMLRFGPVDGPQVVLALPLFEEANRCRALGVSILRALAEMNIGGTLPDLPGQGESAIATEALRLPDLRAAFAAVPGSHNTAIRSGALIVDERPSWLLSPQDGPALLRELARVKGAALEGTIVDVAGNSLSCRFINELGHALPELYPGEGRGLRRGGCRTVRLSSHRGAAHAYVDGPALWRRAEPDNDRAFAETLAADIANWIATCGG